VDELVRSEEAAIEPPRRRAPRIGWHVRPLDDGRFQARAWDPRERKKRAKTCVSEAEAVRWARATHARLAAGVEQAGTTPAQALLDDYIADRERTCRSAAHVAEVKRILMAAIAFGITDLRSDRCTAQATMFLLRARALHRDGDDQQPAPLAPRTLNRYRNALSAWGRWALRRRRILHNPFSVIESVEVPSELPATFTLDELAKIVDPRHADHPAFLYVVSMVYLGIRQNEAANLDLSWFRWSERMVFVRGKRGKERLVPIPREFDRLVRPIAAKARLKGIHAGPLSPAFVSLSRKSRQKRFDRYLEHVGVDVGDRHPHSCRATWISLMLATGEPETLVQLYAGHDKIETTADYARGMVQYRRAVEKWPRGELPLRAKPKRRRALTLTAAGQVR
jgi:integrase